MSETRENVLEANRDGKASMGKKVVVSVRLDPNANPKDLVLDCMAI